MTQVKNDSKYTINWNEKDFGGKGAIVMLSAIGNIKTDDDNNDDQFDENGNPIVKGNNPPPSPNPDDKDKLVTLNDIKYKLSETGDLLNEDGTVFKTKAEYDDLIKPVLVTINDVEYKIDDKGNAINEQGEVVYTAEQLESLSNPEEEYIDQIIKVVGLPITDDKGNAIKYEDSPLGISKYIADVSDIKAQDLANDYLNTRYERFPVLKSIEEHLILNNGRIDNFQDDVDYSGIVLNEDNEQQLINIIVKEKMEKGETEEEAVAIANMYKKEAILMDKAKLALSYLDNKVKTNRQDRATQALLIQQEEEAEEQKYWSEIQHKVLRDRKIKIGEETIVIPEVMKRTENGVIKSVSNVDFFDYMYTPYKYTLDGEQKVMTRNQYDLMLEDKAKSTSDYEVYEAYMRYIGYDKSQLVFENKNTKIVKDLKDRSGVPSGKSKVTISYKTKNDIGNINTK